MKLFKLLFSKIFISALALLVQVLLILTVLLLFEQYVLAFQIFSLFVGVVIFMDLVAKKESPEFKLPWLFVLIALPFSAWLFTAFSVARACRTSSTSS